MHTKIEFRIKTKGWSKKLDLRVKKKQKKLGQFQFVAIKKMLVIQLPYGNCLISVFSDK